MDLDEAIRREQEARKRGVGLTDVGSEFDKELYGGAESEYVTELGDDEQQQQQDDSRRLHPATRAANLAQRVREEQLAEGAGGGGGAGDEALLAEYREAHGSGLANTQIAGRENDYQKKHRYKMTLSPERGGDALRGAVPTRSYAEIMQETALAREKEDLLRKLKKQEQDKALAERAAGQAVVSSTHFATAAAAAATVAIGAGASFSSTTTTSSGSSSSGVGVVDGTSHSGGAAIRKRRRWDTVAAAADDDAASVGGASTVTALSGYSSEGGGSLASSSRDQTKRSATIQGGGLVGLSASDETPVSSRAWAQDDETVSSSSSSSSVMVANRWDSTPVAPESRVGIDNSGGATPLVSSSGGIPWETPIGGSGGAIGGGGGTSSLLPTPRGGARRSRWDETPVGVSGGALGSNAATSSTTTTTTTLTGKALIQARADAEIDERNRPLTDEDLDAMLPEKGYQIIEAPSEYVPIRTPSRKLSSTPTPHGESGGFVMAPTPSRDAYGIPMTPGERAEVGSGAGGALPFIKPEDMQYFGSLVDEHVDESALSPEELKERRIAKLLLKIKAGTPPQRKLALKQIAEKAREFGAGPLFNQILPLFMSSTLEDQERHVLVKVIDRILFRLDELVRPYVHKILAIIEPMLIDTDYYARVEGREVISNLAKAAGLATMIAVMRPDIDNADEFVRNTTARAFAVVASALGIPALLPFLKAVAASKKSWQARHTGLRIVQQIAILMGCAVLPHAKALVEIAGPGLTDENQKVRIMAALAVSSLAESSHPYGIEYFDSVLRPLWQGVKKHRGKALAAFLKAIGFVIPLMNPSYANYYTREIMPTLVREFGTPDEEMKKIVLKVVKQTCACEGVTAEYIRTDMLPEFFRNFWVRRMALDRRNYRAVVDTTVELAKRVGSGEVLTMIVNDLKDESAPYVRMVMECVDKVITAQGASDIDHRLEELLIDGVLYAFQETNQEGAATGAGGGVSSASSSDAKIILQGFATVVGALGTRTTPYLPQIAGTIKWRLNNKSATVRALAAELVARIAYVVRACGQDPLLAHLGVVLYECLGEEYPETLGSILNGLKGIVSVIGMADMQPPIKDLLPRLTPILKNRHEKVQENAIDLVGRIADRGASYVSAREWMRIVFELLEMLTAPKKAIRRTAVNTFGYIAKAIGPQDVIYTLLNNLRVQERQNRVCTTVAIAIVAEICAPFTVLPSLMNEYRTPDMNVQNGVLKSLSFLFEYIGDMATDYVYAVTPLLVDALMDRDMVHRQIAANAVKHLTLGLHGKGCEDALQHLLNYIWPNIFESSPHVIQAVFDSIEAMRVSLGPARLVAYILQGLFHPARRVREVYWKLYNNLYVYSTDAMTPLYPRIADDDPLVFVAPDFAYGNNNTNKKKGGMGSKESELEDSAHAAAIAALTLAVRGGGDSGGAGGDSTAKKGNRYRRTYLELFV